MLIRFAVCGLMGAARLVELAFSRRNLRQAGAVQEGDASRRTYPLMVALHGFVILVTAFRGHKANPSLLPLLSLTQLLRAWVLWALGERWNTRGAVASRLEVESGGPYHWVRHPNYAVVGLELLLLPLTFGLWRLALLASAANAALLFVRIRDEERLLFAVPGYREKFEDKPRFLPRVMAITNR